MISIGSRVKLVGRGPRSYTVVKVDAYEEEGLVFYKLEGMKGMLFISSSLEEVMPTVKHNEPESDDL